MPYYDLGKCLAALHNINKIECDGDKTIMGYLHRRESKTSTTLPKGSDKILASYIRMFEPMVIKSLEVRLNSVKVIKIVTESAD